MTLLTLVLTSMYLVFGLVSTIFLNINRKNYKKGKRNYYILKVWELIYLDKYFKKLKHTNINYFYKSTVFIGLKVLRMISGILLTPIAFVVICGIIISQEPKLL